MARLSQQPQPQQQPTDHNIFRSEQMMYIYLFLQQDAARDTIEELGKVGLLQLTDQNPELSTFQRPFTSNVKRCEELERKLRFFRSVLLKEQFPVSDRVIQPTTSLGLEEIDSHVTDLEGQLSEATDHISSLTRSYNNKVEERAVLEACDELMRGGERELVDVEQGLDQGEEEVHQNLLSYDGEEARGLSVNAICGAIPEDKASVLERVLFRTTRGNCVIRFGNCFTCEDPHLPNKQTKKIVFSVFYSGRKSQEKANKVIEALQGNRFDHATNQQQRQQSLIDVVAAIGEIQTVLNQTKVERQRQLVTIADSICFWEEFAWKEKMIYHTMNQFKFDLNKSSLTGQGWCPRRRFNDIRHALQTGAERSGVNVPSLCHEIASIESPPTHFETNKLTVAFQSIVDAYGVAKYQEFNPTPFTCVTFPFLFAVMFGDLGHGLLMFLFAVFMLWNERYYLENKPGEIFGIAFGGRYVILLMALFSIYAGFIYNEIFALPMDLFGSTYKYDTEKHITTETTTYAFGLDPIWKQSENELTFTNSLKMKMSIVFGVLQMTLGVCLSALNYLHFSDWISLIHVFVPQFLFLTSIFGYMVVLILIKWGTNFAGRTHCAPSILNTFISMFIGMGNVPSIDTDCPDGSLVSSQEPLQKFLLFVAFISVPWMLFAKPLIERNRHNMKITRGSRVPDNPEYDLELSEDAASPAAAAAGGYDFPEEMVHSVIHTIEFVLGAVSNTASYLRLWALSLAHGQLSTVFWEKTIITVLTSSANPIAMVIAFLVWFGCTLGVLMVMESLSAFLHALRLHWVEFQNKFYVGNGEKFQPFSFVKRDSSQEDE